MSLVSHWEVNTVLKEFCRGQPFQMGYSRTFQGIRLLIGGNAAVSVLGIWWFPSPRRCAESLSYVQLSATPWTVAHQAPRSTGFSRPEYRSGLPCPLPGNLPHPGLNSGLLHCGWALYHLSPQGRPGGGLPTSVPFSPVAQSCLTLCDPVEWISPLLVLHPEILTAYHSQIDPNTFSLSLPKSLWFFLPLGSSSFPFA